MKHSFAFINLRLKLFSKIYLWVTISDQLEVLILMKPLKYMINDDICQDMYSTGICSCNCTYIKSVESVKYLGVIIDRFLK